MNSEKDNKRGKKKELTQNIIYGEVNDERPASDLTSLEFIYSYTL